ncbi:alpha/beta hydrolase [uncultured Williamsia sp.]|uniref:alpha/beta fold hydrolase n=1 Tax=uncultured Williamsia sp. TaxID=259311 RepID=UPI00262F9766|nr:alpha/beta hydrolase [uncultured Williamsia sp.]
MPAETGLRDHGTVVRREEGGAAGDVPPILLLHGLMGRGRTWRRQIPWLRRYGRVFTVDAAFHTGTGGVDLDDLAADEIATERFVADIAETLVWIDSGPAVLIGHSMGGLHAFCTASAYPELVSAIVVEDMAPDFRGRTTAEWSEVFAHWPARLESAEHAATVFGPVAGRYFHDAFDDGAMHGDLAVWQAIADEWGARSFWDEWAAAAVPSLLIEAGNGVTPPGQMARMAEMHENATHLVVEGAGHLVHDDRPETYRGAVEAFLSATLP